MRRQASRWETGSNDLPAVGGRLLARRQRVNCVHRCAIFAVVLCQVACATSTERELMRALDETGDEFAELPAVTDVDPMGEDWSHISNRAIFAGGDPQTYVNYALAHHPGLRASWERWSAQTHRVAEERRLPMPVVTYSLFVRQVETRVGPQRHRLSVRQRFPWPGELIAGVDAAAAQARATQRDFEAEALELREGVLRAYWHLWLIREVRIVQREQLDMLAGVAEVARGRLEVQEGSLADLQQVDLEIARLDDELRGIDELEFEASARLLDAVGAPPGTDTPTSDLSPSLELPDETEGQLRASLISHPRLERWSAASESAQLRVEEARNARAPSLSVGLDWIEVGPARSVALNDSGKDAVAISVGIELPLWQSNYAETQRSAEASTAAARSEWLNVRNRAAADLSASSSRVRDTARRADLLENTLIPQAEIALESTLGGYTAGEGGLASILLAERDLLELRLRQLEFEAQHAMAWAELERVVGRPVSGEPLRMRSIGDGRPRTTSTSDQASESKEQ